MSAETDALRLQMIAAAEADLTKDLDPRDPDADHMRRLAKEMATELVDEVTARLRRGAERRARVEVPTVTPAMYAAAIKDRLAELYAGTGVEHTVESTYDPATKRIETVVSQVFTVTVRQVVGKS